MLGPLVKNSNTVPVVLVLGTLVKKTPQIYYRVHVVFVLGPLVKKQTKNPPQVYYRVPVSLVLGPLAKKQHRFTIAIAHKKKKITIRLLDIERLP